MTSISEQNIKKDIKALKDESLSNVVYFIDTDKYDSNPEDQQLNSEIQAFCQQNGYKLIWFCRDVEEVFLHKMVDDSKKKVEVAKFKSGNNLGKATEATLSATSMSKKKSKWHFIRQKFPDRMKKKLVILFIAIILAFVFLVGRITYI